MIKKVNKITEIRNQIGVRVLILVRRVFLLFFLFGDKLEFGDKLGAEQNVSHSFRGLVIDDLIRYQKRTQSN